MLDPTKAAIDCFENNSQDLQPSQLAEYARQHFPSVDDEFIQKFVRAYSQRQMSVRKFKSDVERNWPEEKGY